MMTNVIRDIRSSAPAGSADTFDIDRSLSFGLRLIHAAEAFAAQLAAPELGDIDLPPQLSSAVEQANLRAVAPLYLASELEAARLLSATEVLTGIFVSGGLHTDLGPATDLLTRFWRTRRERLSADERRAIFGQLFGRSDGPPAASGQGSNTTFEELLLNLVEALTRPNETLLQSAVFSPGAQARVRSAALTLAGNLAAHSHGATEFVARDLLEALQLALNIFKQPQVQHSLGANSVWMALGIVSRKYLGESRDLTSHVARGRAGQSILAWLASRLPQIESISFNLVSVDDPVVVAAHTWIEASLALLNSPRAAALAL
jgi:hypothetical protein